ncbi:THO complex subunit 7 homolog [Ruditapes philippinarum]|uniref:THO complex subunit 7 homolog n=1 Tax=Ruditapes philippinarum TaxID=129788 RepID=UPI00295A7596|nr:THO complex subunit 7 homolog [Ruditapes philippinarum]
MASVTDDEVIKKRLLIDGDAGNDEKRLTSLLKTFIRWCNSTDEPSSDESHLTVQRMLATLAQSDHAIQKSSQVYRMNLLEQENYETLNKQIESRIEEAELKIKESKEELKMAKQIRKHRQEYDALAKVIQQQPDRQDTTRKLQDVDEDLKQLEETKKKLEQKLDLRRKQFHVLISAIHELQSMLEEDEGMDVSESKQDEMDTT